MKLTIEQMKRVADLTMNTLSSEALIAFGHNAGPGEAMLSNEAVQRKMRGLRASIYSVLMEAAEVGGMEIEVKIHEPK
jgi:hypothetical protein